MKRPFMINIDTHGACNLLCPSCPMGRRDNISLNKKVMTPEFLDKILAKAGREMHVLGVGLQSWTEPTLHPKLPELIQVVHKHGHDALLSSNLSYECDIKAIMEAQPASLCISLSGYTQPIYAIDHAGGDIELVKQNMHTVAQHNISTQVRVAWHRYKYNEHEMHLMEALAFKLGFDWTPYRGRLMPLESVLNVFEGGKPTPTEQRVLNDVLLPIEEAKQFSKKHRKMGCRSLERELAMDSAGDVTVCCSLWQKRPNYVGNFLELSTEQIQRNKDAHSVCSRCMAVGGHVYMQGAFTWKARTYSALANLWCRTGGRLITLRPPPPKPVLTNGQ